MTRTGRTLDEYMDMGAAGRVALLSFIQYLPPDSALYRELNPDDENGLWFTTLKTNAILADLYDAYARVHTKKGHTAKPYPRPMVKEKAKLGKDPIPISQFWDWWNKER